MPTVPITAQVLSELKVADIGVNQGPNEQLAKKICAVLARLDDQTPTPSIPAI